MSVEEKLLLQCIIPDRQEQHYQWIEEVLTQKAIDWEYVVKLSLAHGIFPLVFETMSIIGWMGVSERIKMHFHRLWQEHLARNIALYSEFDRIMEHFSREGIKVIPLKGVSWARQFYDNENVRSFNDLDFLVTEENVNPAKSLLKHLDYEPEPYIDTNFSPENSWDLGFYRRLSGGKRMRVELHWELARPRDYHIPLKQLWRNSRRIQVKGCRFLSFSPEDTLIYLTIDVHASKYMYLRQFVDVQRFLMKNQTDLDWDYIKRSIRMMGLWNNFCFLFFIIGWLFKDDQQAVTKAFSPERTKRISLVQMLLSRQDIIRSTHSEDVRQLFLLLLLNDRLAYTMKSALRTLFPSLKATAYRYRINPDSKMVCLFYLLNPFLSIFRLIKSDHGLKSHEKVSDRITG